MMCIRAGCSMRAGPRSMSANASRCVGQAPVAHCRCICRVSTASSATLPLADEMATSSADEAPDVPPSATWAAQWAVEQALRSAPADDAATELPLPQTMQQDGEHRAKGLSQQLYNQSGKDVNTREGSTLQQRPGSVAGSHLWLPPKAELAPSPSPSHTLALHTHTVAWCDVAPAVHLPGLGGSSSEHMRSHRHQRVPSGSSLFGRSLPKVFMAACDNQGTKSSMEDAHYLAALDPVGGVTHPRGSVIPSDQVSSAGIFDGHSGALTANFAARHMPELLHSALISHMHNSMSQPAGSSTAGMSAAALSNSFLSFDRWWRDARCDPSYTEHGWDESGATAMVGLVAGDTLTVGNAGDGAAVLMRGSGSQRLSEEHRPSANAAEAERVLMAGGRLVALAPGAAARVVGSSGSARYRASMVTRALGDFAFKHPQALLSPEPAVRSVVLTPSDVLLLMATDGVTDVMGDDDALGFALEAMEKAKNYTDDGAALAQAAARAVTEGALARGSSDNVTSAVMVFDWQDQLSG